MNSYNLQTNYDYLLKILLVGDSGVGKSSLMSRYTDNYFQEKSTPTIGVDFKIKTTDLNGKIYKLQIWDTAGQERFKTITSSYFRGANGIVIVYDVTDRTSFNNLNYWLEECEKNALSTTKILLIGNKSDATEKYRCVTYKEGEDFAKNRGIKFVETSAKNNNNIDKAFSEIIEEICDKNGLLLPNINKPSINNSRSIHITVPNHRTFGCC